MIAERQAFLPSQKAVKAVADSTVSRPRRSRAKYRDNGIVEPKPIRSAVKRPRRVARMDSLSDSKTSDGSDFCLEVPAMSGLEVSRSPRSEVTATGKPQDSESQVSGDPMSCVPQDPKGQRSDVAVSLDSGEPVTQVSQGPMNLGSGDRATPGIDEVNTPGCDDPMILYSDVPASQGSKGLVSESKQMENWIDPVNKLLKRQPRKSLTIKNPMTELPLHVTSKLSLDVGSSERMLMRQWLESEADGGKNPGLKWLDKKEKLIRINWRHGSRAEWSTSDVTVFKCWAQHTGRYISSDPDYKRWKANFRCAVNSLQDVTEVKEKRSTKTGDPYKVYKLLPAVPAKKRRRESVKSARSLSPETVPMVTEEAMATDVVAAERMMESETLQVVDPLSQELFFQLMPLDSVGCESVVAWSSAGDLDCVPAGEDVENLVTLDVPLMCLDHCYANTTDAIALSHPSLPSLPPPPPQPTPFNDAIPLPVQNLIDSSEEFQTMTSEAENYENLNELNVSELFGFAEVNANSVSSVNCSPMLTLESMLQFQALMNQAGFIVSTNGV